MFWKELSIRFTVRLCCEHLSVCVCAYFRFGFKGGIWDLVVLLSDHSIYVYSS